MRAAVFPEPRVLAVVERQTPTTAENQVLVKVGACGVCGTDLHIYRGTFPARFPLIAGHEIAGVVEEAGPGVAHLRPGDHVSVDPNSACGNCRACQRGLGHLCANLSAIGVTADGGFATHCLMAARQAQRIPKEMPFAVAALAEPLACCLHGIDRAQVKLGEVALIIGGGLVGLLMVQLALLRGAATVIISERAEHKRELARQLGAHHVVDPRKEDLGAVVRGLTEGAGADAVIECVGGRATAQEAISLAGPGARVVLFGVAPQEDRVPAAPYDLYRREITITGSFVNPFTQAAALALLESGRVKVADLITHRLALSQLERAFALMESAQATKVVIEP
jgi:2-desacetyl-2-hydroxyethyl bacteriochlorophyllide A dehydrogenase